MIRSILENSRFFIVIAVVAVFLAAILLSLFASFLLIHIIIETILHPIFSVGEARLLALECIELIDVFLLSTAFYIFSTGLYELFVDPQAIMPHSVRVHSLEELKAKLLGVIIVVMSVFFLEQVINWNGNSAILALGISEALIIGVLTLTIKHQTSISNKEHPPEK